MKLRNKKTGEIVDTKDYNFKIETPAEPLYGYESCDVIAEYKSIAELNDEWEDYKPADPLIKDEKVRKAIRAFAELHDSKTITFDETHGGASFISRADNGYSMLWVLGKSWGVENIEFGNPYTIAELCGDEDL